MPDRQPSATAVLPIAPHGLAPSRWPRSVLLPLLPLLFALLVATQWRLDRDDAEGTDTVPCKYASPDVMYMAPQFFLPRPSVASSPSPSIASQRSDVREAMALGADALRVRGHVFVLLNGANDGLFMAAYDLSDLGTMAQTAALALGADADWVALGLRLYSPNGQPLQSAADVDSIRIVHVLLEFQSWVWPGIAIGHVHTLYEGNRSMHLTTLSLAPRVFLLSDFVSQDEADSIVAEGTPHLAASQVDLAGRDGVSKHRTSQTAFLPPSRHSRRIQARAAAIARLPSQTYAEQLHLVQYTPGTYYKPHLDTFGGKTILADPSPEPAIDAYDAWVVWAAAALNALVANDVALPPAYHPNDGPLYPRTTEAFAHALLEVFFAHAVATNYFAARYDLAWQDWLRLNLDENVPGTLQELLTARPAYLDALIKAWSDPINRVELTYAAVPRATAVNGQSHYFRWIRWLKEIVASCADCPALVQPTGEWYPKFDKRFQQQLLELVLLDGTALKAATNATYSAWLVAQYEQGRRDDLLLDALTSFGPTFLPLVVRRFEHRVQDVRLKYAVPAQLPRRAVYRPQRLATVFVYLNDVKAGGATAFPFANGSDGERGDGCHGRGLAVAPRSLHAAFFYSQTPEHDIDVLSRHGGCAPARGCIKFGANAFLWNSDAEEGTTLWRQ
ncbi:hypothetical protein SDRG_14530 [Saprolegnia diclina VS20]|uniref:Prolyl 4-hydroxylase alpha subunit domain-containing protein n=1 Tax=Saprolegnia diclina (strain VS20) TaxID=1156394 RepID=T0RDL1_SAPDV|nr:hypothetical protein SDRG_14530 [Saprolegnia diclina VS20]EQC27692.1 hypothetical protein SDRG_14530 [Saprolegnia diclina VS20]|eukprot:XP_008618887.1 hypothetical protein SDRG_14530 [Saprolegnia diclina VS20]